MLARRSLLPLALALSLTAVTGTPAHADELSPPPVPQTGTAEVQFVGASATAQRPVDTQSLVSVAIPERYDDLYNVAVAYNDGSAAPCTGCRSVAAALQILLVPGQPRDLGPVNGSYAYNVQCDQCLAYAFAKQQVVYVPADFRISRDLQKEVRDVSKKVSKSVTQDTSPSVLDAHLRAAFADLLEEVNEAVAGDDD